LGDIFNGPPQRADSGHFLAVFRDSHGIPGDFLAGPDRKISHGFPDFFPAGNRSGLDYHYHRSASRFEKMCLIEVQVIEVEVTLALHKTTAIKGIAAISIEEDPMKEAFVTSLLRTLLLATALSPLNCLRLNVLQHISKTKVMASPRSMFKGCCAYRIGSATEKNVHSSIGSLIKVCESPLAFIDEKFLDASECAELIRLAKSRTEAGYRDVAIKAEDSEVLTSVVSRVSSLCASESHPDEAKPNIRNTSPMLDLKHGRLMDRGLHLDTNGNPFRYATALIYLSDVKMDGATVFPCSDPTKPDIRAAGRALVEKDQTIAARRRRGDDDVEAAEKVLIDAAESMQGFSVYPKAGRLFLFYTSSDDGTVDPYSWHGGAAVGNEDGEGKWLLQIFKTIPIGERTPEKMANFVRLRRHMHERQST